MKRTLFMTDEGLEFLGEISDVPGQSQANSLTYPRRILKVSPDSWLTAGQIIVSPYGRRYLCAEHGDGHTGFKLFRAFRLLELDRTVEIRRRVTDTDPLTGLPRAEVETIIGTFDAVFEPLAQQEDLQVAFDRYRMYTKVEILKDDRVDQKYRVVRSEKLLGVYVSEIQ